METSTIARVVDDAKVKALGGERAALQGEVDELIRDLRFLPKDEPEVADRRKELMARLETARWELQKVGLAFQKAKRERGEKASREFAARADYQEQVLAAVASWAETFKDWLALRAIIVEARRAGIETQAMPSGPGLEIEIMVRWVEAAIRRGTIDPKGLPASLQELIR